MSGEILDYGVRLIIIIIIFIIIINNNKKLLWTARSLSFALKSVGANTLTCYSLSFPWILETACIQQKKVLQKLRHHKRMK